MASPKWRASFAIRLRLTSDWSNVGVEGVGGKVYFVAVPGVAVEGVDGSEDNRLSFEGEAGTAFS